MSIEVYIGPMYSSKSSELIKQYHKYEYVGKRISCIKYSHDTRYDIDSITSHDMYKIHAIPTTFLSSVDTTNIDVIIIDEIQFFADKVEFCENNAKLGKIIICAGLKSDYRNKPFAGMAELIAISTNTYTLKAICTLCHSEDGIWSKRTVQSDQLELIGGKEMYIAVCRKCYYK